MARAKLGILDVLDSIKREANSCLGLLGFGPGLHIDFIRNMGADEVKATSELLMLTGSGPHLDLVLSPSQRKELVGKYGLPGQPAETMALRLRTTNTLEQAVVLFNPNRYMDRPDGIAILSGFALPHEELPDLDDLYRALDNGDPVHEVILDLDGSLIKVNTLEKIRMECNKLCTELKAPKRLSRKELHAPIGNEPGRLLERQRIYREREMKMHQLTHWQALDAELDEFKGRPSDKPSKSCNVPGCRHKNLIDHTHPDIPGAETLIFETQTAAGKGLSMAAVLRPGAAGMLEKLPTLRFNVHVVTGAEESYARACLLALDTHGAVVPFGGGSMDELDWSRLHCTRGGLKEVRHFASGLLAAAPLHNVFDDHIDAWMMKDRQFVWECPDFQGAPELAAHAHSQGDMKYGPLPDDDPRLMSFKAVPDFMHYMEFFAQHVPRLQDEGLTIDMQQALAQHHRADDSYVDLEAALRPMAAHVSSMKAAHAAFIAAGCPADWQHQQQVRQQQQQQQQQQQHGRQQQQQQTWLFQIRDDAAPPQAARAFPGGRSGTRVGIPSKQQKLSPVAKAPTCWGHTNYSQAEAVFGGAAATSSSASAAIASLLPGPGSSRLGPAAAGSSGMVAAAGPAGNVAGAAAGGLNQLAGHGAGGPPGLVGHIDPSIVCPMLSEKLFNASTSGSTEQALEQMGPEWSESLKQRDIHVYDAAPAAVSAPRCSVMSVAFFGIDSCPAVSQMVTINQHLQDGEVREALAAAEAASKAPRAGRGAVQFLVQRTVSSSTLQQPKQQFVLQFETALSKVSSDHWRVGEKGRILTLKHAQLAVRGAVLFSVLLATGIAPPAGCAALLNDIRAQLLPHHQQQQQAVGPPVLLEAAPAAAAPPPAAPPAAVAAPAAAAPAAAAGRGAPSAPAGAAGAAANMPAQPAASYMSATPSNMSQLGHQFDAM